MALNLITAPTVEPITLQETKDHLRVDHSDDDSLISPLITAARMHFDGRDGILGRCLITQTWDYTINRFPVDDCIRLPLAPVASITSITYTDSAGASQTFDSGSYSLNSDLDWLPRIDLGYEKTWSDTRDIPDAVTIRFVAGYGFPADVPDPIKQAMLLLIGHWYENREEVVLGVTPAIVPQAAKALIAPYRRGWI